MSLFWIIYLTSSILASPWGETQNDVSFEILVIIFLKPLETNGEIVMHSEPCFIPFIFISRYVSLIFLAFSIGFHGRSIHQNGAWCYIPLAFDHGNISLMFIYLEFWKQSLLKHFAYKEVMIPLNFHLSSYARFYGVECIF